MKMKDGVVPSPGDLAHHGIKGMRWGFRKDQPPMHGRYSARRQIEDQKVFGKKGVQRINKRMHEGKTHKQASRVEAVRQISTAALKGFAITAATLLAMHGDVLAQSVAKRAETNRGRAQAAATMGLPRKATNGPTFASKSRSGVHKITSL